VLGVEVKDNDLSHADVHGFVIFSNTLIKDLLDAIKFVKKKEKIILDLYKKNGFTFNKF
jgi:hypothetical protein